MGVEGETSNGGKQESLSIDEKEEGFVGINDIMIRRMKNRERQRRYRARKRLREEADENLCNGATTQSCEVATRAEPEIYSSVENFAMRVYCSRDWKQDARRAHLNNSTNDGLADSSSLLRRRIWPCRRDWKAEARKMKN